VTMFPQYSHHTFFPSQHYTFLFPQFTPHFFSKKCDVVNWENKWCGCVLFKRCSISNCCSGGGRLYSYREKMNCKPFTKRCCRQKNAAAINTAGFLKFISHHKKFGCCHCCREMVAVCEKFVSGLKPNTHHRRDETVLSRHVGVGGVYMNSQLAHDNCQRIR